MNRLLTILLLAISPRAWGWPADGLAELCAKCGFPTRVGMAR